jgi:hypothetical protein
VRDEVPLVREFWFMKVILMYEYIIYMHIYILSNIRCEMVCLLCWLVTYIFIIYVCIVLERDDSHM